jgi:hypothetical protein
MSLEALPPEEDARAILRLALRHEHAGRQPGFGLCPGKLGFLAQQCVENLLKGLIVLADQQPPLTHDLGRLPLLAQTQLPEELLELQDFAVKPRYLPGSASCGLNWRNPPDAPYPSETTPSAAHLPFMW